jgi:5-methylthioadenosine/S-adenosylhomocysteine deaminase
MALLIQGALLPEGVRDVLIQDGRFAAIAPQLEVAECEVLDARGLALLPSFSNAHTHAAMTLLRGYADDMELYSWLSSKIWPFEAHLTPEDVYWGAKLACLEMLKTGTTFFVDMYWHPRATVRAALEMGMRAAVCGAFFDFGDPKRAESMRQQVRELYAISRDDPDHVQFVVGAHAIYSVSGASLVWLSHFAQDHGLKLHLHLSETRKEVEDCLREHGLRPVQYLYQLGVLGPHVVAAHGVWLDPAERELLAAHGVGIVHNPVSNMKLASGALDYGALRRAGVRVALGTDGCASNNTLDMRQEMRIASLLAKLQSLDPCALPAAEALEMATASGAALFSVDAGRIAVGALADAVLVDLQTPAMTPMHHLVSNWVYSGGAVVHVLCAGRVVVRYGRVDGEEEILAQAQRCAQRLREQAACRP